MDLRNNILTPSFHSSCVLLMLFCHLCRYSHSQKEFQVGVILDMGSWNGKIVHSCITMATSDFYNQNAHYKTRIVPQTTDSKGDPLQALEAGTFGLFVAQKYYPSIPRLKIKFILNLQLLNICSPRSRGKECRSHDCWSRDVS